MDWLNYHHLLYFWTVAKNGSVSQAAHELRLAPPTISAQVKSLEEALGEKLFQRRGRNLVLNDVGRTVYEYAEQIFALGQELTTVVRERVAGQPLRLHVGLSDVVAKMVVREILQPAFGLDMPVRVVCREGHVEDLLAELATYRLDVVLTDRPSPAGGRVKTYDHLLGDCGLTFFAAPRLAALLRPGFPASLDHAPAMLPTRNTAIRQSLNRWFDRVGYHPRIVAEFEDTATLMIFAADELGFFAAPSVIREEVGRRYGVEVIGETEDCREQFYAISVDRKIRHPAVLAITEAAQASLFG